jgi:hypothetical protein
MKQEETMNKQVNFIGFVICTLMSAGFFTFYFAAFGIAFAVIAFIELIALACPVD